MALENRVRELREKEGVSRALLSRLTGIAERTLRKVEDRGSGAPTTKHKIVKGFNKIDDRQKDYTFEDLFPNG